MFISLVVFICYKALEVLQNIAWEQLKGPIREELINFCYLVFCPYLGKVAPGCVEVYSYICGVDGKEDKLQTLQLPLVWGSFSCVFWSFGEYWCTKF